MPGEHISDEQRRKFMKKINDGNSVKVAAAKSDFSCATGYRIIKDGLKEKKTSRKTSPRSPGGYF